MTWQSADDVPAEWLEDYWERVGILRFDGGVDELAAHRQAAAEIEARLKRKENQQ